MNTSKQTNNFEIKYNPFVGRWQVLCGPNNAAILAEYATSEVAQDLLTEFIDSYQNCDKCNSPFEHRDYCQNGKGRF